MKKQLKWPLESSQRDSADSFHWQQPGSNLCLDFHGDPLQARLVVFSDGNHHMALEACCQAFVAAHPEVVDIFYATTPPNVIYQSLLHGSLMMGNLQLSIQPDVFISPSPILDKLVAQSLMHSHRAFAKSRGNVFLVKKGNPKNVRGIRDLLRADIILTLSNPVTETASYDVYKQTLLNLAEKQSLDLNQIAALIAKDSKQTVFGESIHHREVPQTLFSGQADVAMVYYHLALRYTRIFPDNFELIELDNTACVYTDYHIGLIRNGGVWAQAFVDFMHSDVARQLYQQHGLTN